MNILYINGVNEEWNKIINDSFPQLLNEKKPELILSNGGDGTVLRTFRAMTLLNLNVPIMILKGGTFNYLPTDFNGDFKHLIDGLIECSFDEYPLYFYKFQPLEVSVNNQKYLAINDVLFGHKINDYHEILVSTNSNILRNVQFKGMGISVCSSIGSTGFHLNNQGQIFDDNSVFGISNIVSNININDIVNTPYVVLKLIDSRTNIKLYIDNHIILDVNKDEEILIKYSKINYQLAYLEKDELINKKAASAFANRKKI